MNNNLILVRFGELSTKGHNKNTFIKKLNDNIKQSLKPHFPTLQYEARHDHIYITLNDENYDDVKEYLKKIPGLSSFSLVKAIPNDIEIIAEEALNVAKNSQAKTFKIISKRVNKLFPMHSDEINRYVASKILHNTDKKVDVHNPELEVRIMVRDAFTYIYCEKEEGLNGYPLGIAGKALMLLSGGIDSPVASYLMMKRGIRLEMIHFAAPPYTSEKVLEKITDLMHKLNVYQPEIKLYIVPFTKIQEKIYEVAGTSYAITIMRRMMLRIAESTAHFNNDLVLATGESVGQVASQTLKSIVAIEDAIHIPIIRPLATTDKIDIIKISQAIDTYDISIRPYEDCCTIFKVKDPTTCPHMDKIKEIEAKFDFTPLIQEAINNTEKRIISLKEKDEF